MMGILIDVLLCSVIVVITISIVENNRVRRKEEEKRFKRIEEIERESQGEVKKIIEDKSNVGDIDRRSQGVTRSEAIEDGVELGIEDDDMSKYSYLARTHMMTDAEEKCFRILEETFSRKFYVFPQVHLSKILNHKVKGQNFYGAFQHINGKSVDFVLVRKTNLELVCAVELDDYTHNFRSRQNRDSEVERMFEQAEFPLIRITNPQKISRQEMIEIFRKKIVETGK